MTPAKEITIRTTKYPARSVRTLISTFGRTRPSATTVQQRRESLEKGSRRLRGSTWPSASVTACCVLNFFLSRADSCAAARKPSRACNKEATAAVGHDSGLQGTRNNGQTGRSVPHPHPRDRNTLPAGRMTLTNSYTRLISSIGTCGTAWLLPKIVSAIKRGFGTWHEALAYVSQRRATCSQALSVQIRGSQRFWTPGLTVVFVSRGGTKALHMGKQPSRAKNHHKDNKRRA